MAFCCLLLLPQPAASCHTVLPPLMHLLSRGSSGGAGVAACGDRSSSSSGGGGGSGVAVAVAEATAAQSSSSSYIIVVILLLLDHTPHRHCPSPFCCPQLFLQASTHPPSTHQQPRQKQAHLLCKQPTTGRISRPHRCPATSLELSNLDTTLAFLTEDNPLHGILAFSIEDIPIIKSRNLLKMGMEPQPLHNGMVCSPAGTQAFS